MSRPVSKSIYIIMFGKRAIAAFKHKANAEASLAMMSKLLPKSMIGQPRIDSVPIQD